MGGKCKKLKYFFVFFIYHIHYQKEQLNSSKRTPNLHRFIRANFAAFLRKIEIDLLKRSRDIFTPATPKQNKMPYTYTDENGIYTIHAFVDTPPTARRGRERAFAPEPAEFQATEIDGEHINTSIGVGATRGKLSKSILRELGKLPKTKTKRLVIVADIPENDELKKENDELKKELEKLKKKNKELHTQLTIRDKMLAERNTDVSYFPYDERDVKEMIGEQYDQNEDWEFTCEDGESADNWFNEFKEYACEEMNGSYGELSWKEACENMIDNFVCADGNGGVMWNY